MGIITWLNPFMPLLGVLAVASPIIIHLLNKRRYKIINWAAMDFLFEAEKKNRRRVKLENFLLLLLRCLAMLLIGLFLARLFLPSALTRAFSNTQQFQHVILLDDSLSQNVQEGNESGLDRSKAAIKQLLNASVTNNRDDWLTIILTSQPDKRFIDNEPVDANKLNTLLQRIDDIKISDAPAKYDDSLLEIEGLMQEQKENVNRVVYVVSDLRQNDWLKKESEDNAPNKVIDRISQIENVVKTFMVDVGNDVEENLTVTKIEPADQLIANTTVRFNVTVINQGRKPAHNIQVRFQVDDSATTVQTETVQTLAPGESRVLVYRHMFNAEASSAETTDVQERIADNLRNYQVSAEIVHDGVVVDSLTEDSKSFFAARVLDGIPVLLVDGDPSTVSERSETHFLRSLDFLGTGLLIDTITVSELETVSLSKYKVIFLCNVDEAGSERIDSLKQWTADGGGLVIMPGDQVRAATFNEAFYDTGLAPFKLTEVRGDTTLTSWKHFALDNKNVIHPAFKIVKEADDNMLENIEIFSWWGSSLDEKDKSVQVFLRINDENNSVAMAERIIGQGRVVGFSVGADADWTMWPANDICYPLVMIPLIEHLVGNVAGDSQVTIGSSITHLVDLSNFDRNVSLVDPANEKIDTTTKAADENDKSSIMQKATFTEIDRRGIYKLMLQPKDSREKRPVFFAANVSAEEGDLKRLDLQSVGNEFFGNKTSLVSNTELANESVNNGSSEIWYAFLIALGVILGIEQFLGWWFGRKR